MPHSAHTDASALRAFEQLTLDEKLREIWLNGNETNGSVAALKQRVDKIEPFVYELVDKEQDTNTIVRFIRKAGGIGNATIITIISIFGAVLTALEFWQLTH